MLRTFTRLAFALPALLSFSASASFIDYANHEINLKVAYVGPTRELTSQSLQYIFDKTNPDARGKKVVLAEKGATTYDVLPLSLGMIRGFTVKVQLYAFALGPSDAELATKLLKGIDGVVFVADSAPDRASANQASLKQLKAALGAVGFSWEKLPRVFLLDHRDLEGAAPVEKLKQQLAVGDAMTVEGVSRTGVGVFDALKSITKQVLTELRNVATDAGAPPR